MVVGVSGIIGAGKDTIANVLVEQYSFSIVRFADELKTEVLTRLRLTLKEVVRSSVFNDNQTLPDALRWLRLRDRDEDWWTMRLQWEVYERKQPIVRALLQEYGTEVRRTDQPDYWIDRWEERTGDLRRVVAPDVRFVNEANAIARRGGLLVKVERPGVHAGDTGTTAGHASERFVDEYQDWHKVFVNDGSVRDLAAAVDNWCRDLLVHWTDVSRILR